MFEKNMKIGFLLDFYGDVLDEHTRGIMNSYYEDDLSLSEIAEGLGISRQGVRHVIKKGEDQLLSLEDALGLAEFQKSLTDAESKLKSALDLVARIEQDSSDARVGELKATLLSVQQSIYNRSN